VSARLPGPRIELGTERESLLQVLDEDANFGGEPATGRPYGKDWHRPLKLGQKPDDSTFSEFCGEQPRWRLAIPRCSRTPILICSISLVRKTPVGITCFASRS